MVSVGCSVKVNFACWIKLCPSFLKWTQAGIAFGWFKSFQLLFNLTFKLVSDLPRYWRLHRIHSSKKIIHWCLYVMVWYMLETLFNWLLLNELYLPLGHNIKLILLYYVFCFYLAVFLIKCYDWFINKHITEFRIALDVPIFLTTSDMFGSILLYVNPKDMFLLLLFFSLF